MTEATAKAVDAINDFTRTKMREESVISPLLRALRAKQLAFEGLSPEEQERVLRQEKEAYERACREHRNRMQRWFEAGRYDQMAEAFCHEGLQVVDCHWEPDIPVEERWFDIGLCSFSVRVHATDLTAECWAWENPYIEVFKTQWPAWHSQLREKLKPLGEYMLRELDRGADGC